MNEKSMKTTEYYTRVVEIYTTGAFCSPMKLYLPHLKKDEWIWRVNRFDSDSYMDGHYVDPADLCQNKRRIDK